MKYLKYLVTLVLLFPTELEKAVARVKVGDAIVTSAEAFGLDPSLLRAICHVESRCKAKAVNHNDGTRAQKDLGVISKSYGMFQIKKGTAKGLGWTPKEDLLDPEVNAYYAAKLLRYHITRYSDVRKAISAYNAGKAITGNAAYVNKVLHAYAVHKLNGKLP